MNPGVLSLEDINMRIDIKRLADRALDRGDGPVAAILEVAVRTLDERIAEAESRSLETVDSLPPPAGSLLCRNVRVNGRRTSVKLEPEFWDALDMLARQSGSSLNELCEAAARLQEPDGTLTSAIRVFVVRSLNAGQQRPA